jgi:hypothetical protein
VSRQVVEWLGGRASGCVDEHIGRREGEPLAGGEAGGVDGW